MHVNLEFSAWKIFASFLFQSTFYEFILSSSTITSTCVSGRGTILIIVFFNIKYVTNFVRSWKVFTASFAAPVFIKIIAHSETVSVFCNIKVCLKINKDQFKSLSGLESAVRFSILVKVCYSVEFDQRLHIFITVWDLVNQENFIFMIYE